MIEPHITVALAKASRLGLVLTGGWTRSLQSGRANHPARVGRSIKVPSLATLYL